MTPPSDDEPGFLLNEDGGRLLTEDGDGILLEGRGPSLETITLPVEIPTPRTGGPQTVERSTASLRLSGVPGTLNVGDRVGLTDDFKVELDSPDDGEESDEDSDVSRQRHEPAR